MSVPLEESKEGSSLALIVQKYGGSSVATPKLIQEVAKRVWERRLEGHDLVVVVSAMKGETNRLINLIGEITDLPDLREYDSLLSTGEQVAVSLLSIAIHHLGGKARSLLAFQVPIKSDSGFKDARITRIETARIKQLLGEGSVVVVAGFQGVAPDGHITTLGRGGSDTTAVALAAALKADLCEIYSDVDGVYTADPNVVPDARRLDKVGYEEVLELASLGAKVIQIRAVEMAMKHQVPVMFRHAFQGGVGTVMTKGDKEMESVVVSGVTYDKNECKITVSRVPDRPGVAAALFLPLAEANIAVDMIIQNVSEKGYADLTFTVRREDLARAKRLTGAAAEKLGAAKVETDDSIAKVSIVGMGMRTHAGVASRMFQVLSAAGINIQMISTSEIKVSCVIDQKYSELAVQELHQAFELGKKPAGKALAKPKRAPRGKRTG
jgi:aspartate kinase